MNTYLLDGLMVL